MITLTRDVHSRYVLGQRHHIGKAQRVRGCIAESDAVVGESLHRLMGVFSKYITGCGIRLCCSMGKFPIQQEVNRSRFDGLPYGRNREQHRTTQYGEGIPHAMKF